MFATTNVSATTFLINRSCLYNFCAQNTLDLDAWFLQEISIWPKNRRQIWMHDDLNEKQKSKQDRDQRENTEERRGKEMMEKRQGDDGGVLKP